jgi:hypothetical protein
VLVVDYIPGLSLRKWVEKNGPLPWREACACIRQAALGLGHAHAKGVVHRDVKPSNLMRSERDDGVSVIDWGLALDRQSAPRRGEAVSIPGQVLGTPEYLAPEQSANASAATAQSDFYGLGCTWYELLTGSPPFQGEAGQLAFAHARTPVPALPAELGVPEAVETILRKLLEKKPEDRYQSAEALIEALDQVLGRPAPTITPTPMLMRDRFPGPRRRLWLAATAIVLGAAGWRYRGVLWSPEPPIPAIRDLIIELSDTSPQPTRSGKLGATTFVAHRGDQVTLRASLSTRAYCYLLSFRPDGAMEVWAPPDETTRPDATAKPQYPAGRLTEVIELGHGAGLQAFAVVASRRALPEFRTWRKAQGQPPWGRATPAEAGIVWRCDGRRVETMTPAGIEVDRGTGTMPRGASGAVAALAEWLGSRPGIDAVFIKAFAVQPDEP